MFFKKSKILETQIDEYLGLTLKGGLIFLMIGNLLEINYLGYFAPTFIFLIIGMYWMLYKRLFIMTIVSAGFLVMSYFAIYKLLQVPLPAGILFE